MMDLIQWIPIFYLEDDRCNPIELTMRYERTHKANARKRILEDAARRFRTEGLSGASVATVMQDTD